MKIKYNFHNGAYVEYLGDINDPPATVEFIDTKNNICTYKTNLSPNTWSHTFDKHYIKWKIVVTIDEKTKLNYTMDLENKRVLIIYPYKTLGDFLFWLPVFERFRIENKCHVMVYCSNIKFIEVVHKSYPEIFFTDNYVTILNESIYAVYEPTLRYFDDKIWGKPYPKPDSHIQTGVTGFLGLSESPIILPKIDSDDEPVHINGKYVCITEHGASNPWKSWCNPNGYPTVARWLVSKGYKVVPISNEPTNLADIDGVINMTGKPLKEMIRLIKNCDLMIGGATGPTCVSMMLGIETLVILTNILPTSDFPSNYHQVYNHTEGTCYGCYSRVYQPPNGFCDKRNPMPECIMNVTPEMVIDKIKEILTIE